MAASRSALGPLTSVRFLAAARVALYHFSSWADKSFWWRGLLATPISVSYFFVSSGFLLAYNYAERSDQGEMNIKRFLLGRVARLLPVYFLGLLVAVPMLVQQPAEFSIRKTVLAVLLLQSWSPGAALYWNAPAWALSTLGFFYVSLPLILRLTRSISRKTCVLIGAAAWAVSIALGLLYLYLNPDGLQQITNHSQGYWLYVLKYNPLARLPEFLVGVVAGRYFLLTGGFQRRTSTAVFVVSTLVLLAALLIGPAIPYPVINSGLLTPALALVIASLASAGPVAGFLKWRWFMLLGQSSFCLYTLHVPLWHYGYQRYAPVWNVALLIAIVLVCVGLYEWVEKPATFAMRNILLPSREPASLPAATPVAAAPQQAFGRDALRAPSSGSD